MRCRGRISATGSPTHCAMYTTPEGRAALHHHAYNGEDRSLIYKHVLSPWAEFCVAAYTPTWLA